MTFASIAVLGIVHYRQFVNVQHLKIVVFCGVVALLSVVAGSRSLSACFRCTVPTSSHPGNLIINRPNPK